MITYIFYGGSLAPKIERENELSKSYPKRLMNCIHSHGLSVIVACLLK